MRLGLGVLTTVLVAWVCAAWLPTGLFWGNPERFGWQRLMIPDAEAAREGLPDLREMQKWDESAHWGVRGGIGWWWADIWDELEREHARFREFPAPPEVRRAGWPFLALESRTAEVAEYHGVAYPRRWQLPLGEILRRGIPTHEMLGLYYESRLGLIPIFPGLALDTVLYAGLWAAGIGAVGWVRRLIVGRRARGFEVVVEAGTGGAS